MGYTNKDFKQYNFGDEWHVKFHFYGQEIERRGTYQGFGMNTLTGLTTLRLQTSDGAVCIPIHTITSISRI